MPLQTLEEQIVGLVEAFFKNPYTYFNECELHAEFFSRARSACGSATTRDGTEVNLLRYEYNSFQRYVGEDQYEQPHEDKGKAARLDFALLDENLVSNHDHLTVVNKDEVRRTDLRRRIRDAKLEAGIEFKMAHVSSTNVVQQGQLNVLKEEMLKDCRKLAHEQATVSYLLGFSHGPPPDANYAETLASDCIVHFREYNPDGDLRVLFTTPSYCRKWGRWLIDPPPNPEAPVLLGANDVVIQPVRGQVYEYPDEFGELIRVIVCKVGAKNSRVFRDGHLGGTFLVPNGLLRPCEGAGATLPGVVQDGQYGYLSEAGEVPVTVTVTDVGPCRSRVELPDGSTRLIDNHLLHEVAE